ncbi:exported protein of unknown function [Tenacibaculum sp. 190524A02b]|uniref:Lipoprotein n=2 Tax=Tenacibaculum vairaonense TaxID=3137860 RepID=A0ABM9PI09_9FLAO
MMKNILTILVFTLIFTACTDAIETPPENERPETQAIDKSNSTHPTNSGGHDPDDNEE